MKLRNCLLAVLVVISTILSAQTESNRFAVGLYGGLNEYNGDLGNGMFKFKDFYPLGALSLSTYVSPSFNLGVLGSFGKYGFKSINDAYPGAEFLGNKYDASMYLDYKLNNGYILSKTAKFYPFLTAGIGLAGYMENNNDGKIFTFPMDLVVPVGAGLKYQISDNFAIQYKYLYNFTNHDEHDLIRITDNNDRYGQHLLGFVISMGGKREKPVRDVDSDGDGVVDSKDLCPNTPAGVAVDANGCPLDSDGDGVADYLDKCPNTPRGAKVDADGCPVDTDGDGVADYLDKCPDTPKGVKVDANGCPIDTDGDGTPDYLDKCPTIPGPKENDGCPLEAKKMIDSLAGIQFEFNSSIIKPESYPILDEAVKTMKNNPNYNLDIAGHTDNMGEADYNQWLSERRAKSVADYLTEKGIDASRFTTTGYGETMPIADNETVEGRAKNRRVDFFVK